MHKTGVASPKHSAATPLEILHAHATKVTLETRLIALTSTNVFRETILAMQMQLAQTTKEVTRVHATQDSQVME